MILENGSFILGERPCYCVDFPGGVGKQFHIEWCRRAPKRPGGFQETCYLARCPNNPSKKRDIHEISRTIVECGNCKGTGIVKETLCDSLGAECAKQVEATIPVLIFLSDRPATWNEQYLGRDALYSLIDYGDYRKKENPSESILADVRQHLPGTQAIKLTRSGKDPKACDAIAVYCNRSGYSVRAFWEEEGEKSFRNYSADEARMIGMQVYNLGGNGTLAASLVE